jgi:hypothetical protein
MVRKVKQGYIRQLFNGGFFCRHWLKILMLGSKKDDYSVEFRIKYPHTIWSDMAGSKCKKDKQKKKGRLSSSLK